MLILVSNASSFDSLITLVWSSDLLRLKMITMENAKETDNADIFTLFLILGHQHKPGRDNESGWLLVKHSSITR